MKKLVVLAVTALFAFAVSAQNQTPAAKAEKKETKMEAKMEKKEAAPKKVAVKKDAMKKETMKKNGMKKEVAPKMEEKK